jgi:O-antigen/teichoic acid export membrane protein
MIEYDKIKSKNGKISNKKIILLALIFFIFFAIVWFLVEFYLKPLIPNDNNVWLDVKGRLVSVGIYALMQTAGTIIPIIYQQRKKKNKEE